MWIYCLDSAIYLSPLKWTVVYVFIFTTNVKRTEVYVIIFTTNVKRTEVYIFIFTTNVKRTSLCMHIHNKCSKMLSHLISKGGGEYGFS